MNPLEECAVDCPYCGEPITMLVDTSCDEQSYIEDCKVCCRPIVVDVQVDEYAQVSIQVRRDDE